MSKLVSPFLYHSSTFLSVLVFNPRCSCSHSCVGSTMPKAPKPSKQVLCKCRCGDHVHPKTAAHHLKSKVQHSIQASILSARPRDPPGHNAGSSTCWIPRLECCWIAAEGLESEEDMAVPRTNLSSDASPEQTIPSNLDPGVHDPSTCLDCCPALRLEV